MLNLISFMSKFIEFLMFFCLAPKGTQSQSKKELVTT